ncbi:histidine phosphatase family protein [Ideonella livida]|uniref:Histidine phosphatase family protein n=1 Tax=Ideonella livida TaxID=2707176 RepID=A0A7C9PJE0_9BURK|nr:histidine phosphatase family protein [Ideonella livida]NDY92574.1 histidine phosphatase family protein [Ideonella livida]
MGTLCLVRHGQASLGAADYDQLSPLGHEQCERLGRHLRWQGRRFQAVHLGGLRRHRQSLDALAAGYGPGLPPAQVWPGLNEYDSDALVRPLVGGAAPRALTPGERRQHFRLLRQALLRWMAGEAAPAGHLAFTDFRQGVVQALEAIRQAATGPEDVLVVSSGGPISVAMGWLLGLAPEATIELNMRLRNSALSEWLITPRRYALQSFNMLPHLDGPEADRLISHA